MREMQKDPLLIYLRTSCRGKDNRVSGAQLARIHGISISALQGRIRRLRQQGYPIASDAYGYYYAVTAGEVFAICPTGFLPPGIPWPLSMSCTCGSAIRWR